MHANLRRDFLGNYCKTFNDCGFVSSARRRIVFFHFLPRGYKNVCCKMNSTNISGTSVQINGFNELVYGKHEFVTRRPDIAIPSIVILSIGSLLGTFGNGLILVSVATRRKVRNVESIFIVNLAISDLYVTAIADPMSIVAKFEGEHFFIRESLLCQLVASLCTISCVTSLMTISIMSVNRYFYICQHETYKKIFTSRNSICICVSLYVVGVILVLLNLAGIGDHSFDRKSLECIWDRMATFPYTVVFSLSLIWLPLIVTGACYLRIYLYVQHHRRKVKQKTHHHHGANPPHLRNLHLAKTVFIIYAVFFICWAPYASLMIIDSQDSFPHELHLYITIFAHLHPSTNWVIYYLTNKRFAEAYRQLLFSCLSCKQVTELQSQVDNDLLEMRSSKRSFKHKRLSVGQSRRTAEEFPDTLASSS